MRKWKKHLAAATASVLAAVSVPMTGVQTGLAEMSLTASAEEYTYGDLTYEYLTDGTIEITDCDNEATFVVNVPARIDGVAVTSIGDWAFYECTSLNSITIPDSVTNIGRSAFQGCTSLNSVAIPDGVTSIDSNAFYECTSLNSVAIPDGVTSIGDRAFYKCTSLIRVTIPDSVTSIGDGAFEYCTSLTSITIPDSVTSIGDSAFIYCDGLTSITIPDSVTSIGDTAFSGCISLTSITIPDSVTSIGSSAFSGTPWLTNQQAEDPLVIVNGILIDGETCIGDVTIPDGVTSIGDTAFSYCDGLTSITIPDSVTSIRDYAFFNCYSLTSITIPDSVTSIGDHAFSSCISLTSITIPGSVTSIRSESFSFCTSLIRVTIPDSVTSIEIGAFYGCSNLTDVYYTGTEEEWDAIDFRDFGAFFNDALFNATIHFQSSDPITTTTTTTTITSTTRPTTTTSTTTRATTTTTTRTTTRPTTTTVTTTKATTTTTATTTTATTSQEAATFLYGVNNWQFGNYSSNFGDTYFILDSYYNALLDGLSNTEKADIRNILSGTWGGSCYGMACTSILSCYDILSPGEWQDGANFLHDIDGPPDDDVESLINYYFALQRTDEVYQYTTHALYDQTEAEKLQNLISCVEDGSPTLLTFFGYFYGYRWSGHAVVAYDVEYGTWVKNGNAYNGRVLVYDNNNLEFDSDSCLYFNTSNMSWAIPCYSLNSNQGSILGLVTDDLDIINYHGYLDGNTGNSYDSYIAILSSAEIVSDYSLQKVDLNANGWTINNSTTEDEIKMFAPLSENGESNGVQFALKDGDSGYLMQLDTPETLDLSMRYENSLLGVTAENANEALFDPSGYVEVNGTDADYTIDMIYNDGYGSTDWHTLSFAGSGVDEVSVRQNENGYLLSASNLNKVLVSANNDTETATLTFTAEDYQEALVYEIDAATIGVAVDSDGNGTYETTIAQSGEIPIEPNPSVTMYGDVTLDGTVTMADVILLNKAAVRLVDLTDASRANADCDLSGEVDGNDAMVLLRFQVQLIGALPYTGA